MDEKNNRDNKKSLGDTVLVCIFCKFMTPTEFELDIHLYEHHRMELVKLPIAKANINTLISCVIEEGKRIGMSLQILNKEARIYLHSLYYN